LVDLDLGGKTLTGNVTYNTTEAGTLNLENGTINGDLTVTAPNATVNNHADVTGTVTIQNVSSSTWNQYGDAGTINFNDADAGTNFNIKSGTIGTVNVNSPANVTVEAASTISAALVINSSGSTVTNAGNVAKVTVNAENVTWNNSGTVGSVDGSHAKSVYDFTVTQPENIIAGQDVHATVTLAAKTLGIVGYENALIIFKVTKKPTDESTVSFTATDSLGNTITQTNSGVWGPPQGFPIDANYNASTDWTLNFDVAGDYTIELKLVDQTKQPSDPNYVIAIKEVNVTVAPNNN
jgi:hypothetical protein